MKWFTLGICGVLTLSLVGCGVSKDKYMQLEKEKQQLEERMARLVKEKEQLAGAVEDLEAENQRLMKARQELQAQQQENQARTDSLKQSKPVSQEPKGTLDAEYK